MWKLEQLMIYAKADAARTGLSLPAAHTEQALAKFLETAGRCIFNGPDDPVGDNRRRNLFISVFLHADPQAWRDEVKHRLNTWRAAQEKTPWFKECETLVTTASDDDLAKIMLSSDEEATRIRISFPVLGLLTFEQVLWVKRNGVLL